MRCAAALLLLGMIQACRGGGTPEQQAAARQNDVPVSINDESPFDFPPDLYERGVEGEVRLRLFVDSTGAVHPESTRVTESSGTPELDSAAVRGATALRFIPAHRNGRPIGLHFYQPVTFRRGSAAGGPPIQ